MTARRGLVGRGLLFFFLWYMSIVWCVLFIYCPILVLVFFSRKWFRKFSDIILAAWEMYPPAMLEILVGSRIYISGDTINPDDGAVIIMNHRNRVDWFFLWAALLHGTKPPAHRCKFVLKSDVKEIPGIGWALQIAGFLYIHRSWEKDQALMGRSLDYFKELGNKYQILIFPEGTNFAECSKAKSNAFAAKQGQPAYDYVLHPRTTGFAFLIERMRQNKQIDAVYDLTIGYPKTLPHTEADMLFGMIPEEVHFQIKRHPISELPLDESGVKKWCEERWAEKEKVLEKFYTSTGEKKLGPSTPVCERAWNAMYFVLWGWTAFTYYFVYLTFTCWFAFCWAVFCTICLVLVSRYTDGIQQIEIDLHHYFDKPKSSTLPKPKKETIMDFKDKDKQNGNSIISGYGDVKID